MAIVAQCTNCGKKYKVAETSVGKQVRCQACQNVFVVAASPTAAPTGSPSSAANQKANQQQAQLAQKLGLKPLPKNENKIFPATPYRRPANQPDPLANHVVYDAGFAPVSVADYHATQVPKEQSMHDYMKQIEEEEYADSRRSKPARNRKQRAARNPRNMYLIVGIGPFVGVILGLILALLGLTTLGNISFFGILIILLIILNFYFMREIFSDTSEEITKCLIIPGYIMYYTYANWSYMKHPFLASLVMIASTIAAIVLQITVAVIYRLMAR